MFPHSTLSTSARLALLAPDSGVLPLRFRRSDVNAARYDALLASVQKLRGAEYLKDGAISAHQLESDGRHVADSDRASWHILSLDGAGRVTGCSRVLQHSQSVSFKQLLARKAAVADDPQWGARFRAAIESEISIAGRADLSFVELGGWAIQESARFTSEALRIALATYALCWWFGGAIGITTATVRNCSSRILRKLGGAPLSFNGLPIPSYYDSRYRCEMEVLRFDSRQPESRFQSLIEPVFSQLAEAAVIWRTESRPAPVFQPAVWQYAAAPA